LPPLALEESRRNLRNKPKIMAELFHKLSRTVDSTLPQIVKLTNNE